ncbi:hypothetical protein MED222_06350 [Vibrio sp. MED222]|nr:hypothetical protein MED222_06350 [Vibrio sp. MED222]
MSLVTGNLEHHSDPLSPYPH